MRKRTDLIKRIIKTKRGQTVTAYDSNSIGYVRFSLVSQSGKTVHCEVMHREAKPFRFGLYD